MLSSNPRYYDPKLARFLSADTVVSESGALTKTFIDTVEAEAWAAPKGGTDNPQDLNRYSYTNNNPVTRTDASGHCTTCLGAVVGGLVGAALYVGTVVRSGGKFNAGDALLAVGGGAAAGALLGTPGLQGAGLGMASSLLADHTVNLATGSEFNRGTHIVAGTVGAVGGAASSAMSSLISSAGAGGLVKGLSVANSAVINGVTTLVAGKAQAGTAYSRSQAVTDLIAGAAPDLVGLGVSAGLKARGMFRGKLHQWYLTERQRARIIDTREIVSGTGSSVVVSQATPRYQEQR